MVYKFMYLTNYIVITFCMYLTNYIYYIMGYTICIIPNVIKLHGVPYRSNTVIHVKCAENPSSFVYCMIKYMYVYDDIKLFLVQALEIKFYVDHYKSFVVTLNSSDVIAIVYDDFFMHGTLIVSRRKMEQCT